MVEETHHGCTNPPGRLPGALKKIKKCFAVIKSSSQIKYEHIHPLSHYLRIQSLKFGMKSGIGQVDARTSTYEHSDHLQSLKFAPLSHKGGEDSLALHGIPSGRMRIEATQLLKNGENAE